MGGFGGGGAGLRVGASEGRAARGGMCERGGWGAGSSAEAPKWRRQAPRITRCTRRSRCRTGVARSAGSTRAAWRLAPPSPRQCSPQARPTRLARRRTRAGVCRGRVASRPTPACAAARRPAPPAARACDATVSRLRGGVALLAFRGTRRCLSDWSISVCLPVLRLSVRAISGPGVVLFVSSVCRAVCDTQRRDIRAG